jgi:choline-glycine betaine transporter
MKKRIETYLQQVDELLEHPGEEISWEDVIQNHLIQIQFFQHERFIHLIVTVLFALMTTSVVVGIVATASPWLTLLMLPLLVLLFPYINHYYLLENGVQRMYDQYDEMVRHRREQKNGNPTV